MRNRNNGSALRSWSTVSVRALARGTSARANGSRAGTWARRVAPLLAAGLVAAALLLAGCGGSGAATDGSGDTEESATAAADTARPEGRRMEGGWSGTKARKPGQRVSSPFKDPTELVPDRRPNRYERTYDRDSLKRTQPLVVPRSGRMPFDDPGVPPISGDVRVSEDGEMVRLPAGTFLMGLTDEDPFDIQNAGRLRASMSPFHMDRFEVSNAEYRAYLDSLSAEKREERRPDSTIWENSQAGGQSWASYFYGQDTADHPVVAVTWNEAKAYCQWERKRLPTEAEWEYAARSGNVGGIYPWSGFTAQAQSGRYLANYDPGRQGKDADGYAFTAPVDAYPPSPWGLHNMSGNVAEWVADTFTNTYNDHGDLNPFWQEEGETRHVVRGGSWSSNSFRIGVGFRDYQEASEPSLQIGFRCAVDPGRFDERRSPVPTARR